MAFDLFVSYARKDNAENRIAEFVEHIKTEYLAFAGRPLEVFFDLREIHGMQDWRHRILQGLHKSRLLLACLSPVYFESEWCEWEFNEYVKSEIGRSYFGDGVAPIYFVDVPSLGNEDFKQRCGEWIAELRRRNHFDFRPWFHAGLAATLRITAVAASMDDLKRQIRERLDREWRAEQSLGNVDTHNLHFAGRRTELRLLREHLALGQLGVLTAVLGLGGVGKTSLATEYAHAYAHEYGGGRWQVRCEGKTDLRLVLAGLHTALGLAFEFTDEEKLDLEKQFQRVLRELKKLADAHEPNECLLILDNVDKPELLAPEQTMCLLGEKWLHILATSRLGESELHGPQKDRAFIGVDELPEDDALEVVRSFQPDGEFRDVTERDAALEIVRLLGGFPLAVEAAAVYLGDAAEDGVSCAGFLERLRKEGLEGLDAAAQETATGVRHGEKRLRATLLPTLGRLTPAERCVLEYAALLPSDAVALPWLRTLATGEFPGLGRDAEPGRRDPWLSLARRLFSLRLLKLTEVDESGDILRLARMHRLLQDLLRQVMDGKVLVKREKAVLKVVRERVRELEKTTKWREARWELKPLEAMVWAYDQKGHEETSWLMNIAGQHLYTVAEWTAAEPLFRRALAIDEESFGMDPPAVARDCNNLASLLQYTNRLDEAEPLFRRALAIDETSYGPNHPDVARVCNNLALLLQATNRLAEAELLFRRALTINEANFGPDHLATAMVCNNLAGLLQHTNRPVEAERLFRQALAIDETSFGPDHPSVSRDCNNLALLLQATNRPAEAEPLYRRALTIDEANYGPDHPEVAIRCNNLASLLQTTNRPVEAEPLFRRALTIGEAIFGPNHPTVATRCNNLASLLQATNRPVEAEPLLHRALAIHEASFGPDHPKVATNCNNLAGLLLATNRPAEAEPLLHRALAINEASFGPDHPKFAMACKNLAGLLLATNRPVEAEPLLHRALAIDEASYGPNHPDVAWDCNNLGLLFKATNRLAEAEPLFRRALAIDEASYGPNHPDVARDCNNLGLLFKDTNRLAEAEPLLHRALAIDETSYGPNHPDVARDCDNLGLLFKATIRLAEAEPLFRRALAIGEASLGLDHPDVATWCNNLADLLQDTNRLAEAEPLYRRALAIDEASYGPDHPNVARDYNNLASLFLATNRLTEAEPYLRGTARILLLFQQTTGYIHPNMETGANNYAKLLRAQGLAENEIRARFESLSEEAAAEHKRR
jgi:tetratricopeptide (TPR) repeat protein